MTARLKYAAHLLAGLLTASCASDSELPLEGEQTKELAFDVSIDTHECSPDEDRTILAAMNVLLEVKTTNRLGFGLCVMTAPLVETGRGIAKEDCALQLDRLGPIWEVYNNELLDATCKDLDRGANGEAKVGIEGTRMNLDHGFLAENINNPHEVAGTIVHELMHNRGFRHVRNRSGTDLYPLTLLEQVEACVEKGTPNPAPPGFPDIVADCQNRAEEGDWFCSSATGANGSCLFHTKEFQELYGYTL